MSKKGKLRVHRFTNILKKNFNYENKNKYSLSPFVDQMQRVKTDSIRPQNKVGLPISVSDLMFLNIKRKKDNNPKKRRKRKTGWDEIENKIKASFKKTTTSVILERVSSAQVACKMCLSA